MSATAPARATRAPYDARLAITAIVVIAALAVLALIRGGLLGLPPPPPGTTRERAGIGDLAALAARARALESAQPPAGADSALEIAAGGIAELRRGAIEPGLASLRRAIEIAPRDLVIGNAYRMEVFRMRRAVMADAAGRETLAPTMPPALDGQPVAFLDALHRAHPSRETTLQLALAWADEIVLNGALEIKAPASVESVKWFTEILREDPSYVPALYGRGLNYLHRPARLVWPERVKAPPDAASRDFGACVAIGRALGGASPRLVASLAMALGDAFAKEGRASRARSWWQIGQGVCGDRDLRAAFRRRFTWQDGELLDRLEEELQGRMLDLDHPMTDLAIMWR
jgi:hypothetical protein